jgi:hypothetical protein
MKYTLYGLRQKLKSRGNRRKFDSVMLMIQLNQIRIKYLGEFIVICKNLQFVEQEKCLMKKTNPPLQETTKPQPVYLFRLQLVQSD